MQTRNMNLRAASVTVIIWTFFGQVYTKFYLEISTLASEKSTVGRRNWNLYECDRTDDKYASNLNIICNMLTSSEQEKQVYEVANFNSVMDLELLLGSVITIDGIKYINKILPAVLAVGVEPRKFHNPIFKPGFGNVMYTQYKITKHLAPFVDSAGQSAKKNLQSFFSVNNIGYFRGFTANTPEMFASYVAVLKRVIGVSEFHSEKTFNISAQSPSKESPTTKPKCAANFQSATRPQSKAMFRVLSWARTKSKSFSRSVSDSLPKILSWCSSWPQSRTPSRNVFRSLSKLQSRSLSPSRLSSGAQTPSRIDVLEATVYLALKMFDPCFALNLGDEEVAQAESACKIYCLFLNTVIKVCMEVYSERCKDLQTGQCVNGMCVCSTGVGLNEREVNMVFCNNAFRLTVYAE